MANKKIKEAIDYGDYPERINPNVERSISDPEGLYATNPAMRRGAQDVERLVASRFKKIVDHLKNVTGISDLSTEQVKNMFKSEAMRTSRQIVEIEIQHTEELERLAIEVSLEETEVPVDWFEFEVSLNADDIDPDIFRTEPENDEEQANQQQPELPSFDVEDLTPEEQLELEKHKRNIINAIIQGAAKKGHHLYEKPEVRAKLDQIDQRLYPLYKRAMSINDYLYFSLDWSMGQMMIIGQNFLTKSDDDEEDGQGQEKTDTKIVARAFLFPVLCHEIIKGIKEAIGRHGLPKDPVTAQRVMGKTDLLQNEPIQLVIGPELYEKLRMTLPDEMYSDENKGLIGWFEMILYQYPAQEFLKIIGNVISDDESKNRLAQQKFIEVMREATNLKNEYDSYREDNNIPPDNDDNLEDFLSGMGIKLPD